MSRYSPSTVASRRGDGWFAAALLAGYAAVAVVLGIAPVDRAVWWAENLTAWIPVAALVVLWARGVRFSRTAYALMFVFFVMHTVGGHYTFENVPFGWVTRTFGFARNHYDRVCHFAVGVFAWPAMEWLEGTGRVRGRRTLAAVAVFGILGFAALFEIVEWTYAAFADPQSGTLFLGSQGDPWDAQKDMLADGLGALCTAFAYCLVRRNPNRQPEGDSP